MPEGSSEGINRQGSVSSAILEESSARRGADLGVMWVNNDRSVEDGQA